MTPKSQINIINIHADYKPLVFLANKSKFKLQASYDTSWAIWRQPELSEFDEKLRHFADQRISLDPDDGMMG